MTVLDTRKTTPGYRALAKYAVRCGGGTNHRAGLFDGVLIKDNHIRLAGGIEAAVARVRARRCGRCRSKSRRRAWPRCDEALAAGADIIMLDNLDDAAMREAIAADRRAREGRDVGRHDAGAGPDDSPGSAPTSCRSAR